MEKFAGIALRPRERSEGVHKSTRISKVAKKGGAMVCAIALPISLSACSITNLDSFRPEVNRQGNMIIDPNNLGDALGTPDNIIYDEAGEWDYNDSFVDLPTMSPDGSSNTEGVIAASSGFRSDELTKESLPYAVVSSMSYGRYLHTFVFKPVEELIKAEDSEVSSNIYVYGIHTGFAPVGINNSTIMQRDYTNETRFTYGRTTGNIGGTVLPQFALDYLTSYNGNEQTIKDTRSLYSLMVKDLDGSMTWLQASSNRTLKPLVSMWGNPRFLTTPDGSDQPVEPTLSEFRGYMALSSVGTIPDLKLKVKTNKYNDDTATIVLNRYSAGVSRYEDNITRVDCTRLFTACDQWGKDSHGGVSPLQGYKVDDHCLLYYSIDGWTKTMIMIGTDKDHTLKELLGDNYSQYTDIMQAIKPNTAVSEIKALEGFDTATTIASGARGVIK